jgi:class 3 adenylate cyclase
MNEAKVVDALSVFVDARGFTSWAEKVENFTFMDQFGEEWHELLKNNFANSYIKNLGDGAMIITEITETTTSKLLKHLLLDTLRKVKKTDEQFAKLCKSFAEKNGSKIPLVLGWGVTKGRVKKINGDYIGSDLNKCSRYCGIARPFGIVIDANDFPTLPNFPKNLDIKLFSQKRKLKGIDYDLDVWVTKEISEQLFTREELRESPEVHIAGICFKKEKGIYYVLLGKRILTRKLFPGLYEGCGGQLSRNEFFTEGVKRHYRLEYGIEIEVFEKNHKLYYIHEPNEPIISGISFLCEFTSGSPKSENHEPPTPRWLSEEEFKRIPEQEFIKGLKKDIEDYFNQFKALK